MDELRDRLTFVLWVVSAYFFIYAWIKMWDIHHLVGLATIFIIFTISAATTATQNSKDE